LSKCFRRGLGLFKKTLALCVALYNCHWFFEEEEALPVSLSVDSDDETDDRPTFDGAELVQLEELEDDADERRKAALDNLRLFHRKNKSKRDKAFQKALGQSSGSSGPSDPEPLLVDEIAMPISSSESSEPEEIPLIRRTRQLQEDPGERETPEMMEEPAEESPGPEPPRPVVNRPLHFPKATPLIVRGKERRARAKRRRLADKPPSPIDRKVAEIRRAQLLRRQNRGFNAKYHGPDHSP
jgi:hypothetical protein